MKDDDPRARNNARFARFMQGRDQRGPSPLRSAYGAWKMMDEARRTIPPILLPEASGSPSDAFQQAQAAVDKMITDACLNPALVERQEGPPVNTSRAFQALQRHAAAAERHQDAKGARRAHTQGHVESRPLRGTNTQTPSGQKLRCGQEGFECGWCHFCRVKSGRPCPPQCHHCEMNSIAAKDAASHPDEAAALLLSPPANPKKKPERVRGFQI
jgi:hypothetical protein